MLRDIPFGPNAMVLILLQSGKLLFSFLSQPNHHENEDYSQDEESCPTHNDGNEVIIRGGCGCRLVVGHW